MQQITRAAVIGAGTMGAAIAAHLANAGRPVLLLDARADQATPDEAARGLTANDSPVRDRLAFVGLARVRAARPPALFTAATADLITCGNVEDDLDKLGTVDWIIEAITERLEVKRPLLAKIDAARRPGSIVSSNTSGLPISQLAEGRSDDFRAHFLGAHFFNPPRQMKLLEVTPIASTLPEVVETIWQIGERDLGKGVVVCKDTPNFISNRILTFDAMFAIDYALQHGYTIEEVDLLTGPLIGRPRTATFRLFDLIGIDVMAMVGENLYPNIPTDESRELFRSPRLTNLFKTLRERGWLGNKTGAGFYRDVREANSRAFWPLDLNTFEHRPSRPPDFASLTEIQKERDLSKRLRALIGLNDRAGQYVRALLAHLLGYSSRRVPEIADDVRSVDRAVRWGLNHSLGPFEVWDALGLAEGRRLARENDEHGVAAWVDAMLADGQTGFYGTGREPAPERRRSKGATRPAGPTYWNAARAVAVPAEDSPEILSLADRKASVGVIAENSGASLVDLGDGVAALELHTKMNTLDDRIVEMVHQALARVQQDFRGMVVTGAGAHFSAGANLANIGGLIQASRWDGIDRTIKGLQDALMALRFSPRPVVVAPFGWTLGGGAELAMAGARIVAAAETYLGQVEVGVGLIPAGGGCKELLRRVVSPAASAEPTVPRAALQRVFELIARGKVANSAAEGREWGFLAPTDRIVMNADHVFAAAKREVIALADQAYQPPPRGNTIYAAGRDALAALQSEGPAQHEASNASEYDAFLANHFARVLCGGDSAGPRWVSEQEILDLERSTFVELCRQPRTQERIRHFLETGKPL